MEKKYETPPYHRRTRICIPRLLRLWRFQSNQFQNWKTERSYIRFFKMLFKLIQDYTPSHIAMTFDPGGPLERGKIFQDYKANRKPMPEDLRPQIQEVMDTLEKIGFKILKVEGQEADDVIGTLCETYRSTAKEILIFRETKTYINY